jgi:geranylgeranyl diphosphate synthase type II
MASSLTAAFLEYAPPVRAEIDAALDTYSDFGEGCPQRLREAIRYSLLSPGKRLRPLLVLMATESCGCDREKAMPAAVAVEMIHTYSLIHDDLPAMDDDDLRRGQPTCHAKFGEALAILAGDALLARAFEVLSKGIEPPEIASRCCAALASAAGATELVGGQADDLAAEFADATPQSLEEIHRRKTGSMFVVSMRLGGLVAQADVNQQKSLQRYAQALGLAFQIVDDLLDVQGDEAAVGKRTHKDAERGKSTFPSVLGVPESRIQVRQLVEEACREIAVLGPASAPLEGLAHFVAARTH